MRTSVFGSVRPWPSVFAKHSATLPWVLSHRTLTQLRSRLLSCADTGRRAEDNVLAPQRRSSSPFPQQCHCPTSVLIQRNDSGSCVCLRAGAADRHCPLEEIHIPKPEPFDLASPRSRVRCESCGILGNRPLRLGCGYLEQSPLLLFRESVPRPTLVLRKGFDIVGNPGP